MVRFNGNAEAFEMLDNSLIRLYLRAGCNVMLCNYRGVNPTRRSRKFDASYSTSRDLKLKEDSSILQKTVGKFVRKLERLVNWCVVTERDSMILDAEAVLQYLIRVHQVRRSRLLVFGHSIGGAVAAILSDKYQTPTCNSRSFARLSKIVSGWEMEVARRWPRICRSKWTEYCVGDKIIPYTCSLHHAVHKMKGDVPASGSKGSSLSLEVLDADNHNRIYTKTELAKHVSLMRRALRLSARA
ncbi:hypothetical protein GUITHDRAFT_112289 [Guillardia theta CCMP2712]|uniref:Uncharacterized protein n=1 Tax=Guillardia theta (strain CCMP2712) TaxID=905079 RepID=L1IZ81_GUITC|nr:hypothetical protein GUITHDRAFT_112289 [Guillardia theta CCMP2712]EKX41578.1 hypothetical protein GUITHDRAFT_112289 [Guillardia theta CCMP2712]|eukprot:XP_005828558.1 hypothetical protein GUITHDRAFT_112289 [Guillardia theta CCMP2712]